MNTNAWWKVALAAFVVFVSAIYSLPNLYPDEPAIQISGGNAAMQIDDALARQAEAALRQANLPHKPFERLQNSVLIRIGDAEAQIKAKEVVQEALGQGVVVALNLAPTTPAWLLALGADPMKLGLDLRGGVHFKLEVDIARALAQREDSWMDQIRLGLRERLADGMRYKSIRRDGNGGIEVRFDNIEARDAALVIVRSLTNDFTIRATDAEPEYLLQLKFTDAAIKEIQDYAIEQNRTTIANRVNELGVAEPLVQRQGANRIVVELPGVQDTATAKRILGRTANLEFRLVDAENDGTWRPGSSVPPGSEAFPFKDNREPPRLLRREKIVTGDSVTGATSGFDSQSSSPNVSISLDTKGGRAMQRTTTDNVGRLMAVLFIESKAVARKVPQPDGTTTTVIDKTEEKYIINAAVIRGVFGSQFQITGLDSPAEAAELALLLRSGALAAPMFFVEERTIGPSLGKANIEAGITAALIGLTLVVVFMVAFYSLIGVIGVSALLCNLMLLTAILGIANATLTLPGIAGIVLTMGMAVDANVLINERIKEELRKGASLQQAINGGYDRAWATIFDSNLTTLLVAVILFGFGSGSVKGFAITLSIGILTSMFTAVIITRLFVNWRYGNKPGNHISIQPIWSRA